MARAALRWWGFGLGIALGAFSVSSWAVVTPWPSTFKGATFTSAVTGGAVSIEAPFSVWPPVADGAGGAKFAGKQVLRLPGASAELGLSRLVTVANLARGARIAASFGSIIGLAGLAYEGITWAVDHFEAPADVYAYPSGVTPQRNFWQDGFQGQACNSQGEHCSYSDVVAFWLAKEGAIYGGTWTLFSESHVGTCETVGQCQHTITIKSGATTHTRTIFSAGSDGPTSTMGPASDAQIESSLSSALAADPSKAPGVLEWVKEAVPLMDLNPGPLEVSGPSSVSGPTVTNVTVNDAGTKTENRTTNFNLTYNNGNVTVTQTTTTTVTNPDNSQSTSTETTSAGSGGGSEAPPEKSDLCLEHPEISACQELGPDDPPEPELPHEDRNFSFSPEMSAAGSCPAPVPLSILGRSYDLSWQPLCDLASGVRPVVLALAWLGAAAFVFAVGSRAS